MTRDSTGLSASAGQRFAWLYIGLAAIVLFHGVVGFNKLRNLKDPSLYERPAHDETYYLRIAANGYSLPEGDYRRWSTLPFSPGYPALLRSFSQLTGLKPGVARLVLSSILLLIACFGLDLLYRTFSRDLARNYCAIALLVFWPGSFYFLTGYAEALYLPLAVWCLVCLRQRWFLAASGLASLALFTRLPAVILVPTILVVSVHDWLRRGREGAGHPGWRPVAALAGRLCIYGAISLLGLAAHLWTIGVSVGDPSALFKSYEAWSPASHAGLHNYAMSDAVRAVLLFGNEKHLPVMLGLPFFLAIPLIVFPLRAALPLDLVAFTMIGWLFLLDRNGLEDPFIDMLRWSSILFPVQYCLAALIQKLGSRFRSSSDATACLGVATVLVFGVVYAMFLTRFIHRQWVS